METPGNWGSWTPKDPTKDGAYAMYPDSYTAPPNDEPVYAVAKVSVAAESFYVERHHGGLGHGNYVEFDEDAGNRKAKAAKAAQAAAEAKEQEEAVFAALQAVNDSFNHSHAR